MKHSAMSEPRRILVLTLSFGSGHVRAAGAIAQELLRQMPAAEVRVVDALAGCRRLFRAGYVWPYWIMIRYAPSLWARIFDARTKRKSERTAPEWAFRWGCSKVFDTIAKFNPHTIIATEVAACEMAVIAKKSDLTQARIINVITDYEAEPVWVKPEVSRYFVPDRAVAAQLHAWGAPAANINACGIPVDLVFHAQADMCSTRAQYDISDKTPVVMLMGGGMGPTRMDLVVAHLCAVKLPMHIIAITGHDWRARRRLLRLPVSSSSAPVSLTVLGWSDDVASLMKIASLLVTKPGGLTTAEAAACHLPVVLFDAIPGPERRNAQRFAEAGAGVVTQGTNETIAAVMLVLRDERARYGMSVRARELDRPFAVSMIAGCALGTDVEAIVTAAEGKCASG